MEKFLIDSNIIIDHLRGEVLSTNFLKSSSANSFLYLSVVSLTEIYSGKETRLANRLKVIEDLISIFEVSFITASIAKRAGFLRRDYKKAFADMIIAATALEYGFTLVTRNIRDFKRIPKLKLLKPYG